MRRKCCWTWWREQLERARLDFEIAEAVGRCSRAPAGVPGEAIPELPGVHTGVVLHGLPGWGISAGRRGPGPRPPRCHWPEVHVVSKAVVVLRPAELAEAA